MEKSFDLFEFLQYILGCTYMSDLRIEPYNSKAKLLLKHLDLAYFAIDEITECVEYLCKTRGLNRTKGKVFESSIESNKTLE